MSSFFGVVGNPFATPVGQKIEAATDGSLASENWALNMEICDLVNETEDGPKDAVKAIRKRLQQSVGKNYTIVMYTLTVLETCVKNCGKRFHILVCNKEFISELVKIIGPKNDPPTAVQEKVLSLIQAWADAFHSVPELSGVSAAYQELKAKGIEFPMTDLDAMAPIHTPRKSVKETLENSLGGGGGNTGSGGVVGTPGSGGMSSSLATSVVDGSPVSLLSPEQLAKLRSDLDILQTNMSVFGEMLSEMSPGTEHPSDLQLFQELHATLLEMQERLVELISRLSNDEVTADLLRINDHLNNLFLRYSRYEKNREASKEQLGGGGAGREKTGAAGEPDSLIDLREEAAAAAGGGSLPHLSNQLANMGISAQLANLNSVPAQSATPVKVNEKDDKDFDAFAQSRNVDTRDSGSSYESNRKPDQIGGSLAAAAEARAASGAPSMHKESDFDEMEAWLEGVGDKSVTSSEFERFLEERAMAADRLPADSNQVTSRESEFDRFLSERAAGGGDRQQHPSSPARPPKKEPQQDASLFAL